MTYLIISAFVITIIALLNHQNISNYLNSRLEKKENDFKKRTGLDLWKLTKLYPETNWLGNEQFTYSYPEFYFDDDFLYVIYSNYVTKHKMANITEVSRTSFFQNDRRIWKIIIQEQDKRAEYKITINQSMTSSNFSNFLDKVNENEKAIVDSEWLI